MPLVKESSKSWNPSLHTQLVLEYVSWSVLSRAMKRRRAESPIHSPATVGSIHAAIPFLSYTELWDLAEKARQQYTLLCSEIVAGLPNEIWERIFYPFTPAAVCVTLWSLLTFQLFSVASVSKLWNKIVSSILVEKHSHMCGTSRMFSFSKMPGVKSLVMHPELEGLYSLQQLSLLTKLETLQNCWFTSSLSTLTTLTKLSVTEHSAYDPNSDQYYDLTPIGDPLDLHCLQPLTNLVSLAVYDNGTSFKPLSVLTNLKRLRFNLKPGFHDCVFGWSHLTKLSGSSQHDISELVSEMTNLVSLGMAVDDAANKLVCLTNLRGLNLTKSEFPSNFSTVWSKLERIHVTKEQFVENMRVLTNITKLKGRGSRDLLREDLLKPLVLTHLTNLTKLEDTDGFGGKEFHYPDSLTKLSFETVDILLPPTLEPLASLTNLTDLRARGPYLGHILSYVLHITSLTRLHVHILPTTYIDDCTLYGCYSVSCLTNLTDLRVGKGYIPSVSLLSLTKLKIVEHGEPKIALAQRGVLEVIPVESESSDSDDDSDMISSDFYDDSSDDF